MTHEHPQSPPSSRLVVAASSHPGQERSNNEDTYFISLPEVERATAFSGPGDAHQMADLATIAGAGWVALGVCDGMGGAAAGEVASRRAAEAIDELLSAGEPSPSPGVLARRLVAAVEGASRRLLADQLSDKRLAGMGTTATVCALCDRELYVAQVGDSRAYVFRGGKLTRLTRDQTLATLLVETGQLAPEEVDDSPYGHIILQALGTKERVEVDLVHLRVARGDLLLVCSDGLYGPLTEDALAAILAREATPQAMVEALIVAANEAGGPDNVTCVVARLEGGERTSEVGEALPAKAALEPDPLPSLPVAEMSTTREAAEVGAPESPPRAGLMQRAVSSLHALFERGRK